MAEKTIHFKIITPEKIVYEDDVDEIIDNQIKAIKGDEVVCTFGSIIIVIICQFLEILVWWR